MSGLTTHVLDTSTGKAGNDMYYRLFRLGNGRLELLNGRTNADGRCDAPLLDEESMVAGSYELIFDVADYFRRQGVELSNPPFLDRVVIRFGIADTTQNYHVPLLISPFGYSTYRGS
ncbi:MAG: hydroxyisourate hydrolase [Xanthomonadales bacterium]|nr:hydroxyisourate hydrolase [Xanthomonadales bacterium]